MSNSNVFVYTASRSIANDATRSQAFVARNIPGHTVCKLSQVPTFAKPVSSEAAHAAYAANIEAFLFATMTSKKVSTQYGFYPITDYNPTFPLPIPKIIFRLRNKVNDAMVDVIMERMRDSGIRTLPVKAGPQGFVVENPTFRDLAIIERLAGTEQGTTNHDFCAQVPNIPAIRVLWSCIELFCKTNTYYYRRSEALMGKGDSGLGFNTVEFAIPTNVKKLWTEDAEEKVTEEAVKKGASRDATEDLSFLKHKKYAVTGYDAVLVAKPSPKPWAASCGSARDLPYEPGLLFPYFDGMIVCDTVGLRVLVGNLFFRSFGKTGDADARAGYTQFREHAGTLATSNMGAPLGHILKGISMALQSQTHMFLLFDKTSYLGYALLGDHFMVHDGSAWRMPQPADALKDCAAALSPHETNLYALVEVLSNANDINGDKIVVEIEDIDTSSKLLDVLSEVDETQREACDEIRIILRNTKYPGSYKLIGPSTIADTVDILVKTDHDFGEQLIHIPFDNWARCSKKEYKAFASFGVRAFAFRDRKGQNISIPNTPTSVDFFSQTVPGDLTKLLHPEFIVYTCTVPEAMIRWEEVVRSGQVSMNFQERAKASRGLLYTGGNLITIWSKLKEVAAAGHLYKGGEKAVAVSSTVPEKRKADMLTEESLKDIFDML